LTLDSSNN